MFEEADYRPLSALQHLIFCERQCALIHLEQQWEENRWTAEGRVLHERADSGRAERRGDLRIARSLALSSRRLGLNGIADVVELHRCGSGIVGVPIPGLEGLWRPVPVEYKRGKPKTHRADEVQLCAQALCLEEMLACEIPEGFLYYGTTRRRLAVSFDPDLRQLTEQAAARLHELLAQGTMPEPVADKRCRACSLHARCVPTSRGRSARDYLESLWTTPTGD